MGSVALSRMVQGAAQGLDAGMQRRDRATQRERSETQWQQGQEERDYSLKRRDIENTRADEQYKIAKDKQDKYRDFNNARRNFMMSGDVSGLNDAFNKYSPDDVEYKITPDADGGYSKTVSSKSKGKSDTKKVSVDDIGVAAQMFMTEDLFADFKEKESMGRASKEKKADRAHDISKLEKEYELKRGLKRVESSDKDSKSGVAKSKANLAINKELNDIAVQDYGSLFGDQWKFDTTQDKAMRSAQADLAGAYYFSSDDPNPSTNSASRAALQDMRKFLADATAQADKEIDEGAIDKKHYDNRVAEIVEFYTDEAIKGMTPSPGESLQRGGEQEPAPTSKEGTEIPLDDIQLLKDSPTDENKTYFDEIYGEGIADKILTGEQIGEQSAAPAGVSNGDPDRDISLIRDANAGEVESERIEPVKAERVKRDYSGQKKRKEIKKSQKAHRQIALSEYQNEWKNMSDDEKLEWWDENSGALKDKSPRNKYPKARKEINAIRRKARFSKKGKEEYQLMRENRAR